MVVATKLSLIRMNMAIRKVKNTWITDFYFDRTRYRKKCPENSKRGAEAYEAMLKSKLNRGEVIQVVEEEVIKKSFEEFSQEWMQNYSAVNNKYSEYRSKESILNKHLLPFMGKFKLSEISTKHVERYKALKNKEGLANKTINNHLAVLNKCLRDAFDWEEIEGFATRHCVP